ncbi:MULTISPECIES: hypothetical protein [Synechococcales]|uniref:hypothetical protein n=1 Tax=Synechococcales TaxID=1890424 RepID=UPI000B999BDB|nr:MULTISPECIES: hypothetical protein [Synechococcales]
MVPTRTLTLVALAALLASPAWAEGGGVRPQDARPPGLILLQERPGLGGMQAVGIYNVVADPSSPGLWRIKFWDEQPKDVKVRSETVRCSPAAPMRVTSNGAYLFLRELNPGGPITPANRIDHLVWWATCFPEQAGKDPAGLAALALQLGYSGMLRESEQVLPGRPR